MQTLYFPVDDLPTRGAAGRMTDKRFLEQEIGRWLASDERARQIAGEAYYEGVQDILRRQRTVIDENGKLKAVEHLPNNRLTRTLVWDSERPSRSARSGSPMERSRF